MFYWLDNLPNVSCPSSIRAWVRTHLLHNFLTFYADLIKWADGLTGWPDMTCLGQSLGPQASGPCRAAV
jgi:hypothetical protein